jgi:undecaprenyl-diphosphatase
MTSPPAVAVSLAILRPRLYFALALTAAVAAAVWTWFVFTPDGAVPQFDRSCALYWRDFDAGQPRWWQAMVVLTDLGSIASMMLMAVMGALWQSSLHRRRLALAWFGIVAGGGMLDLALKDIFQRPRPPLEWRDRAVLQNNASYPSGHSMGSTIGYGMLGYALAREQRRRRLRAATTVFLFGLVGAIALSRVYLRAHWFSDVVGGFLIGLAWLCFWLGMLTRKRVSRQQ